MYSKGGMDLFVKIFVNFQQVFNVEFRIIIGYYEYLCNHSYLVGVTTDVGTGGKVKNVGGVGGVSVVGVGAEEGTGTATGEGEGAGTASGEGVGAVVGHAGS